MSAGSLAVTSIANPATAGDAFEQHVVRSWSARATRWYAGLVVGLPLVAITYSLLAGRGRLEELFTGPPLTAWIGLATLVLAEGLLGLLVAWGLTSLRQQRSAQFFAVARDLTRHTVLQGRRNADLLTALRRLQPDALTGSRNAGLPRLFIMAADGDGVMFLGRGLRPRDVAAFHWLHVPEVRVEGPDGSDPTSAAPAAQRVVLVVRRDGAEVPLGFELERAKVAWTERASVEAQPVAAAVRSMQGHRHVNAIAPASRLHTGRIPRDADRDEAQRRIKLLRPDADLAGTDYEREAVQYESSPRRPLEPTSAVTVSARRSRLVGSLVLWALGCAAGPSVLSLFIP